VAAGGDVRAFGGDWRPLASLTKPDVVTERVDAARAVLDGPARAVASVTFLGIASRLVSAPFAALVLTGVLPVPDRLSWRPVPSGPLPIAYETATAGPADARTLVATAVTGTVEPVLRAVANRYRISLKVMWGNVASALAGAAGVLADSRGDHADRAGMLLERALAEAPLAGVAAVVRSDASSARRFLVRHSCCLYYRIAGGSICADCVLMPDPDRRRAWAATVARSPAPGPGSSGTPRLL
jgi:FhuF 2Fe-2S C-terminal domain